MSTVPAKTLEVGMILAATATHGAMSIKQVDIVINPLFNTEEVVVRGPLSIVEKYQGEQMVAILG